MRSWIPRPVALLALVAVGYTLCTLLFVGIDLPFSYDENVYSSQVSGNSPPSVFSASRARGITYLIAPITLWTSKIWVLRLYLAVLAGLFFFAAYYLWLKVQNSRVVPLAALLFGTTWIAIFEGSAVMPNHWVAFGAVAATALTVLIVRGTNRVRLSLGLAGVIAFVGLMRPVDALWLSFALAIGVVWGLRKQGIAETLKVLVIGAAGLVLGWLQWIYEAVTEYGGLTERLAAGSHTTYSSFGFYFFEQLRAVFGPLHCYPCSAKFGISWQAVVFWLMIFGLAVLGAVLTRHRGVALLVIGAAMAPTIMYFFATPIAAPRFFLATYALLAIVCADALRRIPDLVRPRLRPITAGVLALGVLAYFGIQLAALENVLAHTRPTRVTYMKVVSQAWKLGVRRPCVVTGFSAVNIANALGCYSRSNLPLDRADLDTALPRAVSPRDVTVVAITFGTDTEVSQHGHWVPQAMPVKLNRPGKPGWQIYMHKRYGGAESDPRTLAARGE